VIGHDTLATMGPRIVAAGLSLLVACQSHVELRSLPANPTPAERVNAFNALRPVGMTRTINVRNGNEVERTIVLANGEEIAHADDLLPVVPADSATAREARRYGRANRRFKLAMLGFTVAAASGIYVFATADTDAAGRLEQPNKTLGGVLLVGAAVLLLSGGVYALRARAARDAAFASYEPTLLDSLKLCVDGLTVAPCEDLGPPATVTPGPR